MLNTTRSRVRALAVVGMAAVIGVTGAVAFQASAAEVPAAPALAPQAAQAAASDAAAGIRPVAIPSIPEAIKPPPGSRPIGAFIVTSGTQNYTCVIAADGTGAFTGTATPEAQLIGTGGRIHHFAGPTWQSERDQSLVVGGAKIPVAQTGTIPWLRVAVASHGGTGILSKADFINRLYTSGGAAPTGGCKADEVVKVQYKALYVFWDDPATPPVA
jgi:hypothetical protein